MADDSVSLSTGPKKVWLFGGLIALGLIAYLASRSRGGEGGSGDNLWVSAINTLQNTVQDALTALAERLGAAEETLAQQSEALKAQEVAVSGLSEEVSVWQDIVSSLVEQYESLTKRLSAVEADTGLEETQSALRQQMLNIAQTFYLSRVRGVRTRGHLTWLKKSTIKLMQEWSYPQNVIDEFTAWADATMAEMLGQEATGGIEWLFPSYDGSRPRLDIRFDTPVHDIDLADYPVRLRYGKTAARN